MVLLALLAGVGEEALFRGVLLPVASSFGGNATVVALVLSSELFCSFHRLAYIRVFHIAASFVFWREYLATGGNLSACAATHTLFYLIVLVVVPRVWATAQRFCETDEGRCKAVAFRIRRGLGLVRYLRYRLKSGKAIPICRVKVQRFSDTNEGLREALAFRIRRALGTARHLRYGFPTSKGIRPLQSCRVKVEPSAVKILYGASATATENKGRAADTKSTPSTA